VPNFASTGLFCHTLAAKNHNFCHIFDSAFSGISGVANWQQYEKAEHAYTTTNLPLSNGIKIVSGQTDKQTHKNSTFLAASAASEIQAPPHLAW